MVVKKKVFAGADEAQNAMSKMGWRRVIFGGKETKTSVIPAHTNTQRQKEKTYSPPLISSRSDHRASRKLSPLSCGAKNAGHVNARIIYE